MMKKLMFTLLTAVLLIPLMADAGSAVSGKKRRVSSNRMLQAKNLLGSIEIANFVIPDDTMTLSEAMGKLFDTANKDRKAGQKINFVVRNEYSEEPEETPTLAGYASGKKTSLYEILTALQKRGDLSFSVKGNIVYIAESGVSASLPRPRVYGDCSDMQRKLDEIVFPRVYLDGVDFESVIRFMSDNAKFSPDRKGVKLVNLLDEKQMEEAPFMTTYFYGVTLRQLLDSVCFVTGCTYSIRPDRIVFFSKKKN